MFDRQSGPHHRESHASSIGYARDFVTADADVVSIDLPWGDAQKRTAIARRSMSTGLGVVTVTSDSELLEYVRLQAATNAVKSLFLCECLTREHRV